MSKVEINETGCPCMGSCCEDYSRGDNGHECDDSCEDICEYCYETVCGTCDSSCYCEL